MPHAVAAARIEDFDRFIRTLETRGKAKRAETWHEGLDA